MRSTLKTFALSLSVVLGASASFITAAQAGMTAPTEASSSSEDLTQVEEVMPSAGQEENMEAAEPSDTSTDAEAMSEPDSSDSIVDLAASNEDFSILVTALTEAGLVDTLSGEGPFTVFAPTNAAFEALPEGTLETLLQPENKDLLVKILTYHVVSGEITSDQLEAGAVSTVEGGDITVSLDDGVKVNNANVILADVEASNGVIHAIDSVIIPPDLVSDADSDDASL